MRNGVSYYIKLPSQDKNRKKRCVWVPFAFDNHSFAKRNFDKVLNISKPTKSDFNYVILFGNIKFFNKFQFLFYFIDNVKPPSVIHTTSIFFLEPIQDLVVLQQCSKVAW